MVTQSTANAESRLLLADVDWSTYVGRCSAFGDRPVRLTIDRANLEIEAPTDFPGGTVDFVTAHLERRHGVDELAWTREIRQAVRARQNDVSD